MNSLAATIRAARALLGWEQKDVVKATEIKRQLVGRIETGNFKLVPREAFRLQHEYEKHGVEFVGEHGDLGAGVRWRKPGRFDAFRSAQIRAARVMVGWSQRQLGEKSGIDRSFINRLENGKPKAIQLEIVEGLISLLAEQGVVLTPEGENFGAGVRLVKDLSKDRPFPE